ncbi:b(0,+)-type amino acid transporter 1 [Biomphalaria glabrata]|nr:b(0,+)-type amino acid transporter 1 [Biomphalaria glabrata]
MYPLAIKQRCDMYPLAIKQRCDMYPLAIKQRCDMYPLAIKQRCDMYPLAIKQRCDMYPLAIKQRCDMYPLAIKQRCDMYPLAIKQRCDMYPLAIKQRCDMYPLAIKQRCDMYPLAIKQRCDMYPLAIKQRCDMYPLAIKQRCDMYPLAIKQRCDMYPLAIKQRCDMYPLAIKQRCDMYPLAIKQRCDMYPRPIKTVGRGINSVIKNSSLTCLVEEIKSPGKNVPRSIMTGCLFTLAIYVMTNVSYLAVMTRSELLQSNAVAALFADKVLQNISILIPVAVMVSAFGSTNNIVLSTSRITFTAARDGNLPDFLSYIQISQLTPFGAMILTVSLSLLYLLPADLGQFISLAGFLDAFFDACTFVALIRFRLQTMKDAHRPVKIPLLIPILMLLVNVYLFVAPIIFKPRLEYVYVAASVFTGATLLYIPFVRFGLKVPFYDKIVTCLQLIFEVCPPAKSEHKP